MSFPEGRLASVAGLVLSRFLATLEVADLEWLALVCAGAGKDEKTRQTATKLPVQKHRG
jgi:hypothetical protein